MEALLKFNPWAETDSKGERKSSSQPLPAASSEEFLIIVFIHGFKGTDSTFSGFPERLRNLISETASGITVECIVFPAYETKGELNAAVERFADWLTNIVVEKEVARGGGAGSAKVVLCGHSMGGLVAADTIIGMANNRPDSSAPLWPRIIACIAFDTPYLGLHPYVFKNSATKAMSYVQTARDIASSFSSFSTSGSSTTSTTSASRSTITAPPASASSSSSWASWAIPAAVGLGGILVSGAAAGAAYYKRKDIGEGYQWATDHMKYVGTLWNQKKLKERLENLISTERNLKVTFRNFYTLLPYFPPHRLEPDTFIILPDTDSPFRPYFLFCQNNMAEDEVEAHTGMFEPSTNDSYYALGLETAKIIREALSASHGVTSDEGAPHGVNGNQDIPTNPSTEGNLVDL